jgi:surface antigen
MYKARTTKPEAGNKYYIRKASGGWSPCIKGNPQDPQLDALANCVAYAVGRFNEIGGYGCCKYLGSTNAENFANLAKQQGLTVQKQPTLGGCMVWAKGKVGNGSDGAGHVAICERINDDGSVLTSESGWGYKAFYTTKRSGANWGQNSSYTYLGCIVNPAVQEPDYPLPTRVLRENHVGQDVKWMQAKLQQRGHYAGDIDGVFGPETLKALLIFQYRECLQIDGVCGPATRGELAK